MIDVGPTEVIPFSWILFQKYRPMLSIQRVLSFV